MNEHVQTATNAPLFNPLSPEFIRNPYPHYERMRTTDPVHLTPLGMYVASRHAEASLVLRDKRFGMDYVERTIRRYGPKIMNEPLFRGLRRWMLHQDPPDHTRLRGLFVKAFTARRVEDMRPRIQQIVDETLDGMIPQGRMDLIEDFAFRLPVTIICDMLGIPDEHREMFYADARESGHVLDPVTLSPKQIKQGNVRALMSARYCRQLFELRRRKPGNDLTTQLVQAEEDGRKLSNEELTANLILLFGAGAASQSRPTRIAQGQAGADHQRDRRISALRFRVSGHRPCRAGRHRRSRWQGNPEGRQRAVPSGFGQPRLGGLSRSPGAARHYPAERQAAVVRRRHPLLPGRPARAHRGRDRDLDPAAPAAGPAAR